MEDTSLDEDVEPPPGVAALKLLVIWRDDDRRADRVELAHRFVGLAARLGLLSVLEPVVRVPEELREDAIVEAARELGAVRPSLYKCQVPLGGRGDPEEITRHARRDRRGARGARGSCSRRASTRTTSRARSRRRVAAARPDLLAGRALWTATLAADDPTELLRERSVPRLRELADIVDAHGTAVA